MREGVSYRHPSGFLLVGAMNPEEGSTAQLLDRFGLMAWGSRGGVTWFRKSIVEGFLLFEGEDAVIRCGTRKDEEVRRAWCVPARAGLWPGVIFRRLTLKMVRR